MKFTIEKICNYFNYTRQAFYKHRIQKEANLIREKKILASVIDIRKRQPKIGTRKIKFLFQKQSKKVGTCIGRDRLFSLLRANNLLITNKKKYVKTTNSHHRFRIYKNIIKDIDITRFDQVYVSDITYILNFHKNSLTTKFSWTLINTVVRDAIISILYQNLHKT